MLKTNLKKKAGKAKTKSFKPQMPQNEKIKMDSREYSYTSWSTQGEIDPMLITKADGIYIYDDKGKEYIDLTSQLVLSNIGHGNEYVLNAMKEQMDKLCYVSPAHTTEIRAKLAKKLAEITPGNLKKTFFCLGGADANENAIKMAQLYTGKKKVFARYRGYHGGTYTASNVGGDSRRVGLAENLPWVKNFHLTNTTDSPLYRGVTQDQGDLRAFEILKETIRYENPDTVAAIILEGYSGSSGIHNPGKKFWQLLRKYCDQNNILLIVDEVMSGFGRTGKWFGVDHYGITPDIMVMAKGITSGYAPLGAVITTDKIAKHFETNNLTCGLTYSAHALSLAAGLATIEVYEGQKLIKNSEKMGKYLRTKLEELKKRNSKIGDIRGTGLHFCIELNDKNGKPLSEWNKPVSSKMKRVIAKMRKNGLLGLSRWNLVFISPPLIVTKTDIDMIIKRLEQSLA